MTAETVTEILGSAVRIPPGRRDRESESQHGGTGKSTGKRPGGSIHKQILCKS
jgi:hypothetical protein